jgi:5-methylcytosine-specific restriction protein A
MPTRSSKPCKAPLCPALVKGNRYCTAHADQERSRARRHDEWRGTAASRGYDSDWVKVRTAALKRDHYLCQHCMKDCLLTEAKDVDHIVPVRTAPELRLNINNTQSLCRSCHQIKTVADAIKHASHLQSTTCGTRHMGSNF